MKIIEAQAFESELLSQFIRLVFDTHVASGFVLEGREEFYRYIDPDALTKRLGASHWMLTARNTDGLLGVIEVRDNEHLSMLFVRSDVQRQGIGRQLLAVALEKCKRLKPDLEKLTVNASPNAVEAYQRLGFVVVHEEQVQNGIRFWAIEMNNIRDLTII